MTLTTSATTSTKPSKTSQTPFRAIIWITAPQLQRCPARYTHPTRCAHLEWRRTSLRVSLCLMTARKGTLFSMGKENASASVSSLAWNLTMILYHRYLNQQGMILTEKQQLEEKPGGEKFNRYYRPRALDVLKRPFPQNLDPVITRKEMPSDK